MCCRLSLTIQLFIVLYYVYNVYVLIYVRLIFFFHVATISRLKFLKFKLNMLRYFDFHQTWNHNRETSNAMVYSLHVVVELFSRKTIIQEISVDKLLIWHEKYHSKQASILDWKPNDVQFIEVLVCYACACAFFFLSLNGFSGKI